MTLVFIALKSNTKSGKNYWLYSNSSSVESENGNWNNVFIIVDVTHKKNEEVKLIKALERERELNSLKTNFVSLASHEFRTPLASIQSSIDILRLHTASENSKIPVVYHRHLKQIEDEVNRMTYLMNDVLVMGKINADKIDFSPSSVDLVEVVNDVINSPAIGRLNRKVLLDYEGEAFPFYCDSRLITHIVQNLVDNAIKYSDPKTNPPSVSLFYGQNMVKLVVRDHGIGIPENEQSKLFESFWRGSNVSCFPGTGLGLPIVKRFVDMHRGEILFNSAVGKGTTVTVLLPVEK